MHLAHPRWKPTIQLNHLVHKLMQCTGEPLGHYGGNHQSDPISVTVSRNLIGALRTDDTTWDTTRTFGSIHSRHNALHTSHEVWLHPLTSWTGFDSSHLRRCWLGRIPSYTEEYILSRCTSIDLYTPPLFEDTYHSCYKLWRVRTLRDLLSDSQGITS